MSTTPLAARLQILAAALLFSTGGAAIKTCNFSAWQVACFRSGLAALVLAAAFPRWRRALGRRSWLVGVTYASTLILFVAGNKLTTAASTIFLQSTAPMYLLLLGPWLLGERLERSDLGYAAVIAAGLVLFFVGREAPLRTAPAPLLGNALSAVSGVTWALTILGLRWLGRDHLGGTVDAAGSAVIAGNGLAALVALPFAVPVGSSPAGDWLIIAYLGLFQIGLAYVFMTRGVRGLPALETSLLLLVEPVLNAVWAFLVHGEVPGPWSLLGSALIFAATVARTVRRG